MTANLRFRLLVLLLVLVEVHRSLQERRTGRWAIDLTLTTARKKKMSLRWRIEGVMVQLAKPMLPTSIPHRDSS